MEAYMNMEKNPSRDRGLIMNTGSQILNRRSPPLRTRIPFKRSSEDLNENLFQFKE